MRYIRKDGNHRSHACVQKYIASKMSCSSSHHNRPLCW
nr:MAG TPA: hypothetical protein [Caudoviricetes sp.]